MYFKAYPFLVSLVLIFYATVGVSFAQTTTYTYDDLNRLIKVEYPNGTVVEYTYDEVGNRVSKEVTESALILNLSLYWNMISCPGTPAITDFDILFDGLPVVTDAIVWNSVTDEYELATAFESDIGYWVYAFEACQVTVEYQPSYNVTWSVNDIWNLVGSVDCDVPVGNMVCVPDGAVLAVIGWDAAAQSYVLANTMERGHAHWLATLEESATATIDCAAAAPPQQTEAVPRSAWKSTISIQTQSQRQELVFGMHPSASEGFDRSLDRPASPAAPDGSSSLRAYWVIDDPYLPLLSESFVRNSDHASWELSIELPESGEVRWGVLPLAYRCVLHYNGRVINMRLRKSLSLPAGKHSLKLVLDSLFRLTD